MGLQTSGQISLNEISVEAGNTSGAQASINDSNIRSLLSPTPGSGTQMDFADWYGASANLADFSVDLPNASSIYISYGAGYGSSSSFNNGNDWNGSVSCTGGSTTTGEFYSSKIWTRNTQYRIDFDVTLSKSSSPSATRIMIGEGYRGYTGFTGNTQIGTTNNGRLLTWAGNYWTGAVNGVQDQSVQAGGSSCRHSGYLLYTTNDVAAVRQVALALYAGGGSGGNGSQTIHSLTIKEV